MFKTIIFHFKKGSVRSEEMKPALSNGHGGGGGHSHEAEALEFIDGDNATFEATLRGFLVILALSLHAVFEGIALGLTATESSVWYLFFAVASHKFVISFCIGMQFVSSGKSLFKRTQFYFPVDAPAIYRQFFFKSTGE